jgi:hypothetical protein
MSLSGLICPPENPLLGAQAVASVRNIGNVLALSGIVRRNEQSRNVGPGPKFSNIKF